MVVDRRGRLVVHVYLLCGSADGRVVRVEAEPKFDGVVGENLTELSELFEVVQSISMFIHVLQISSFQQENIKFEWQNQFGGCFDVVLSLATRT